MANELPSAPLRILLVDDSELSRALLCVILRGAAFSVVGQADSVDSVASALQLAQRLQPDVVMLDIMMPGELGLEAIRPLKQMLPQVTILMVSGSDDDASVRQAMEHGAHGFVIKPFNSRSVLETMQQIKEKFTLTAPAALRH